MATKLLTLASIALTLTSACQVEPVSQPKKEPITPIVLTTPEPTREIPATAPAIAPTATESVVAQTPVVKKPRRAAPKPAAMLPTPPVVEETNPELSAPLLHIASPRVDQEGRPAAGNVMSRTASYDR